MASTRHAIQLTQSDPDGGNTGRWLDIEVVEDGLELTREGDRGSIVIPHDKVADFISAVCNATLTYYKGELDAAAQELHENQRDEDLAPAHPGSEEAQG